MLRKRGFSTTPVDDSGSSSHSAVEDGDLSKG
jgi:hypothetical protein